MREQKFRAKLKLVVSDWGMYREGDIETFWFNLLDEGTGLIRHEIGPQWEVVEWNQFIGLQDVYKEDIYENDRVSFVTKSEFDGECAQKCTGTIKWDEEDAGFYIDNDDEGYPHVKFWYATNIKLIKE